MGSLQEFGIQLIQAFQSLSPGLDSIMLFFTFLGKIEFYMLFITFLYWIVSPSLAFRVFMVLISTDILGTVFKQLLHQPRPYWIGDVKGLGIETSYGIPSTHASDSLSVWGFLTYQVKKRWFWFVTIAIILLISFSRMYLGVHFPHDILGGWVLGLVILFISIRYQEPIARWFTQRSTKSIVGYGIVISVLFILLGLIIRVVISQSPDPDSWASLSTQARTLTHNFTLAGAFFGSFIGYSMMKSRTPFLVRGTWTQKLARYVVGIIGVLVAMYGLDAIFSLFADDETILGYTLRFIRYGTTTFWVMFGAPWVFLKLRLVEEG